jgi:acetoacetate decarboxylase
VSEVWEGEAQLELFHAPGEEHALLAPVRIRRGYRFTFAYTVDDLETIGQIGGVAAGAREERT